MTTQINNNAYESLTHTDETGSHNLNILVKGVHCALCIQKIETTIRAYDDVSYVRLNFSTGSLNIKWAGDTELADDFARAVEKLGYQVFPYNPEIEKNTEEQESRFLLLCLGVAGFAMGNLMLLSVGLWATDEITMGMNTRSLMHWISALIAIPVVMFSGRPFFRSAWAALKNGTTNMDVPISLALILATGMSIFETLNHGTHVYFDSAVMLMFFLLIGRYLDFRARRQAKGAAHDLLQTLNGFATVVEGTHTRQMLIREIQPDMIVSVAVGEKIPVDSMIIDGESTVDTALVTGETMPRDVKTGDDLYAGMVNLSTPLRLRVAKAAEDSLLADIVRLLEKAEQSNAAYVRLADKAARLYTPVVHFLALSAFILWAFLLGAAWQDALLIAVTVLIITCPCALGLAVPVVQVLATGQLMKRNVLVKSGDALERLAKIDVAVFDKTGTLTLGKPVLQDDDYTPKHMQFAASLAAHSAHPLSKALSDAYDGELIDVSDLKEHAGQGLSAIIDGHAIKLGSLKYCGLAEQSDNMYPQIALLIDGARADVFTFKDHIKDDAKDITATLKTQNIQPILLSGDRASVAQHVAEKIGIDTVYAEQSPVEKTEIINRLKAEGHNVLMVGDGLNDAPVLANANVSMAPGSAVDITQNAADIVFMGDQLAPIWNAYKDAVMAQKMVKQNFALAIAYNCIAVPFAFMGHVTPMIAAICMSASSLLVIINSYRLKFTP
ncbi:MAG: heavy metal translocating P-type ATPase [Alphaproteobacteria bacterium]|nr:heavy metal translocating P-type ATPase [Alphaproteobacteria bacterium]|tara:strand:+ start:4213 stop:6387 length:2175 start_codon:yes stop_codon:yes gene_type:complete